MLHLQQVRTSVMFVPVTKLAKKEEKRRDSTYTIVVTQAGRARMGHLHPRGGQNKKDKTG